MEKIMGNKILEALCEIIKENRANENQEFKERIYQFNELDLFLSKGIKAKKVVEHAQYRKNGLIRTSNYNDFYFETALDIELVNDFLQELSFYLVDGKVQTKYEYTIDGEVVIPTQQQQEIVKNYLKSNNVPINEFTYCLALRRLIVGGDIESKFDREYLLNRAMGLLDKEKSI